MRVLGTYPALASVRMPRSAIVLAVHDRDNQAPALLVEFDPDDKGDETRQIERRFVTLQGGQEIPRLAHFVASWRRHQADGGITALFELVDGDVPDDLDPERHADYRLLLEQGFTPVKRDEAHKACWLAPDDEPVGMGTYQAIARLQEHGYGPIVA